MGDCVQMSLVVTTLKSDLLDCFENMNSSNNGDRQFANEISVAVADYAQSGNVVTVDAGPVTGGAFAGGGSGSIAVQSSITENIIFAASIAMKTMLEGGDDYMALQIATGIQAMITAGQVETDVTGVLTPPTGTPSPMVGTAKGILTCIQAPLFASIKSAFASMKNMKEGGNEYLATQLASAIDTYLKAGIVATTGQSNLSGSLGTGTIS